MTQAAAAPIGGDELDELLGDGDVLAVDFETADAHRDSACSIAIARVFAAQGRVEVLLSTLLRPPRISEANSHVHGIRASEQQAARTLAEVWPRIEPLLSDGLLLVAHNAPFDRSVLEASAMAAGIRLPRLRWACTVRMSGRLWPERKAAGLGYKLDQLCGFHTGWKIPLQHHDAASDAKACGELVLRGRGFARGRLVPPWRDRIAPPVVSHEEAPAPRRSPLIEEQARSPEAEADAWRPAAALELGRRLRHLGGSVSEVDRGLDGDEWSRGMILAGWQLEDLELQLRAAARHEPVSDTSRVPDLQRVLDRPRRARKDLVELIRAHLVANSNRRRHWTSATKEERDRMRLEGERLEEVLVEALRGWP